MGFFKYLKKLLPANLHKKTRSKIIHKLDDLDISQREDFVKKLKLSVKLQDNLDTIIELFGDSLDLNIRKFTIGKKDIRGALISMVGLADTRALEEILDAIKVDLIQFYDTETMSNQELMDTLNEKVINNKEIIVAEDFASVLEELTMGASLILIDGVKKTIICETKGFQIRNISEPEAEITLRGPREGFVENIFTNTALLRQKIRVPHLWFEGIQLGALSKTEVAVAYIKGLASEELLKEIRERLKKIEIDAVLESGYIEEYIKDQSWTLFPLIQRTERPDKVASCLLEGKVAILTSGTPFVLIVPTTYNMLLQSPDDYYESFPVGSFIRLLRHISFLMSILLPGIYIAIINFHPEILPVQLLLRISSSREGVPFPVIVESLLMESLFEILREAGLRLPKAIGPAISIVGALILGDAAIQAGLVSPPMVIIVALTAIASFTTPNYPLATSARLLRFAFIIIGGAFGLFGIQFGVLFILSHLCSLRSFGQPYFQPYGPLILSDLKDSITRLFIWKQVKRPKLLSQREPQRQPEGQEPHPPKEED